MKRLVTCVLLVFISLTGNSGCSTDTADNFTAIKYIPYRLGKLYGMMEVKTKKMVVQPIYTQVFHWNNTMAEVEKNNKWGVIDYYGHVIIPLKYNDIAFDTLNHHRALMVGTLKTSGTLTDKRELDQHDYYDLKGKLQFTVKSPGFVFFWKDTLTTIQMGDTLALLSISGKFLAYKKLKPGADTMYMGIKNNRLQFRVFPSGAFGEEDVYGRITKPAVVDSLASKYISVEKKAFNLYLVRAKSTVPGFNPTYGFIDSIGNIILPPVYGPYDPDVLYGEFNDGRMLMVNNNGKCGYVDTTGRFVIPVKFKRAWPFSENRAAYFDSASQLVGFINRNGAVVIPPKFSMANALRPGSRMATALRFSEGLCLIMTGTVMRDEDFKSVRFSYIDTTGDVKIQLPEEIKGATAFSDGMAMVADAENKIGFINKTGKIVIPMKYVDDEPGGTVRFGGGFAYIRSQSGYIDKTGYEYFKD